MRRVIVETPYAVSQDEVDNIMDYYVRLDPSPAILYLGWGLSEEEALADARLELEYELRSRNDRYLRACLRDCLLRGEAPFASHGLYTLPGVLDDDVPEERELGIEAGLHWGLVADATVVYTDLGVSGGMELGVEAASKRSGYEIEYRTLGEGWDR